MYYLIHFPRQLSMPRISQALKLSESPDLVDLRATFPSSCRSTRRLVVEVQLLIWYWALNLGQTEKPKGNAKSQICWVLIIDQGCVTLFL
jgi:hypothetical protein